MAKILKQYVTYVLMMYFLDQNVFAESKHEMIPVSQPFHTIENVDCKKTESCSLKRASFLLERYGFSFPGGYSHGTDFTASYETDSLQTLEDYVFVQFIQGCSYITEKDAAGNIDYLLQREINQFGQYAPANYPTWTVDSLDTDPAYSTWPGYERHSLYRWLDFSNGGEKAVEKRYGKETPPTPRLFVRDNTLDLAVYFKNGVTYNVALRFRMELYHTKDVPSALEGRSMLSATPVVTFPWEHIYVFNYETNTFEKDVDVVPWCEDVSRKAKR